MIDAIDLLRLLRQRCAAAGGQRAWAAANGVSEQYLSDVLNARREPGDSILRAVGMRKVVRYVEMRSAHAGERAGGKPASLDTHEMEGTAAP